MLGKNKRRNCGKATGITDNLKQEWQTFKNIVLKATKEACDTTTQRYKKKNAQDGGQQQ